MKDNKGRVGILSLGCPRNLVDSESILGKLSGKGYSVVDMQRADIGIVNTCAFIEDAKNESIEAILDLVDLKKQGRLKKVIVYGCLAQRYKDELQEELPEVDAFVGKISLNHDLQTFSISPRHYAYIKVCEGCINNCSYCVIPKIKGRFSSLDINSVLGKIEILERKRVSEVNIIGQDITAYGSDLYGRRRLPALLKRIAKRTKNIRWLRLLYLYPSRISDELLEIIADTPQVCKYIDLPIQHINDRILRLMHRQTTQKLILALIDRIRKRIPDAAIRSSVIVGFPSETEREFCQLLRFIEEAGFERLGAFIYSREEGTAAYNLTPQIPAKVKQERLNTVMLRQQAISEGVNKKFLGRTIEVLIDEQEGNTYLGRSQYDAPEVDGLVYVKSEGKLNPGDFVKVRVVDTLEYDLVGEVTT